jgi:DNA-3-methyladenine glycosylase
MRPQIMAPSLSRTPSHRAGGARAPDGVPEGGRGVETVELRASRLSASWFARDARVVARALLGCRLVHEVGADDVRVARIVETEAYCGPRDRASHARAGLTQRTRTLFGEPGHAYVFLVYGMHDCFNVTCLRSGAGHAVLVRAGEPIAGIEPGRSLRGPGLFARTMALSRASDGQALTAPPLYVCPRLARPRIGTSARVGVAYAKEWADRPWRFFDARSLDVSRPPKSAIGRPRGA